MHIIDQYAYSNRIRAVEPGQKAAVALLTLALCLVLNRPAVAILAVLWMWVLATGWAGLPRRVFARVLLAQGLFLGLSILGIAVTISGAPPLQAIWMQQIGELWVSTSTTALADAWNLASRALGCAAALNFLALTTPLVDLVDLLRRLHTPELLIDLLTLIYRSIFVLLESLQRMTTAQHSRLGYSTPGRSMRSAALLGSRLFLHAYARAQRMHVALESRCATSSLRILPHTYQHDKRATWFALAIGLSLLLASQIR